MPGCTSRRQTSAACPPSAASSSRVAAPCAAARRHRRPAASAGPAACAAPCASAALFAWWRTCQPGWAAPWEQQSGWVGGCGRGAGGLTLWGMGGRWRLCRLGGGWIGPRASSVSEGAQRQVPTTAGRALLLCCTNHGQCHECTSAPRWALAPGWPPPDPANSRGPAGSLERKGVCHVAQVQAPHVENVLYRRGVRGVGAYPGPAAGRAGGQAWRRSSAGCVACTCRVRHPPHWRGHPLLGRCDEPSAQGVPPSAYYSQTRAALLRVHMSVSRALNPQMPGRPTAAAPEGVAAQRRQVLVRRYGLHQLLLQRVRALVPLQGKVLASLRAGAREQAWRLAATRQAGAVRAWLPWRRPPFAWPCARAGRQQRAWGLVPRARARARGKPGPLPCRRVSQSKQVRRSTSGVRWAQPTGQATDGPSAGVSADCWAGKGWPEAKRASTGSRPWGLAAAHSSAVALASACCQVRSWDQGFWAGGSGPRPLPRPLGPHTPAPTPPCGPPPARGSAAAPRAAPAAPRRARPGGRRSPARWAAGREARRRASPAVRCAPHGAHTFGGGREGGGLARISASVCACGG